MGSGNGNGHSPNRLDVDGLTRPRRVEDGSVSGRRFVIAAVVGMLTIWGAVYLAFRDWRARYRALAEYGEAAVARLVDPLADRVPADVDQAAWRSAVADTHAMLVALTSSGLLDRAAMRTLRDDVAARVDRGQANPESARHELTRLWTDLQKSAGPLISSDVTPARPGSRQATRHPRPPRPDLLKEPPPPDSTREDRVDVDPPPRHP